MKFVSCVNTIRPEILSSLRSNFQKQASKKEKVNYFSIVIVLIYSLWVPKSASLFKKELDLEL